MDTRHAVGCAALRGGVPCICWMEPTASQTPLWLAVERLKEAVRRPTIGPIPTKPIPTSVVLVLTSDVQAVLDELRPGFWPSAHDEGGEA
jgi:hypothetical protein